MSLGKASEHLQRAVAVTDALDDGEIRDAMGNLIEAVRLLGAELERTSNPPVVPGTDYGKPPCRCSIRGAVDPASDAGTTWMVVWSAECPVHPDDITRILDMVDEQQ